MSLECSRCLTWTRDTLNWWVFQSSGVWTDHGSIRTMTVRILTIVEAVGMQLNAMPDSLRAVGGTKMAPCYPSSHYSTSTMIHRSLEPLFVVVLGDDSGGSSGVTQPSLRILHRNPRDCGHAHRHMCMCSLSIPTCSGIRRTGYAGPIKEIECHSASDNQDVSAVRCLLLFRSVTRT